MIALIAHDARKQALADWVHRHAATLARFQLVATGTTGGVLSERCPELAIVRVASGPLGGDQQVGAMIVERRIQAVIFFVDPLSPMPHDVDIKALMRLAIVYDVPLALNEATAEAVIRGLVP